MIDLTPQSLNAAVIAYLQAAMGRALGVSPGNPAVWSEYSPDVPLPYAIVEMDEAETYDYQSNDPATGVWDTVVSDGTFGVTFVATSKQQAKALALQCLRVLVDTVADLSSAEGRVVHLRPLRGVPVPITDTGPSTPTVFARRIVVRYRQQFPI